MSFSNSVLVGNWSEERLKNEYDFKLFLRKRDRRELLLQKSRNLFSSLLKERPLSISGNFVLFGYNVQLVASDMPAKSATKGMQPKYGLALSSLVTERQVDYMQNINDGTLMTLSPITTPCCRNTFVILSTADESLRGEKMNYGDEFLLKAENYQDPNAAPLYVRYTPSGTPGPADRMPIQLSTSKDSCCRWTTAPLMTRDHLEGLGSAVKHPMVRCPFPHRQQGCSTHCTSPAGAAGARAPAALAPLPTPTWPACAAPRPAPPPSFTPPNQTGTKLIVRNCVADKSLCVMNQNWMQTFFGPECGITCRNYVDIHGRHTAENIFTLVSDVATKKKD